MPTLSIALKISPKDYPTKAAAFMDEIQEKGPLIHQKWVFRVLEYVVKYSRVATGRSRAAWFPFMDKHGFNYQRSLGGQRGDPREIAEGYAKGTFDDKPMHTTIMNNVDYVGFVNRRWGLFAPGRVGPAKGQLKALKGMKLERGLMFEEKIPQFEAFGQATWQDFLDAAKAAFEAQSGIQPIPDTPVPPPPGI